MPRLAFSSLSKRVQRALIILAIPSFADSHSKKSQTPEQQALSSSSTHISSTISPTLIPSPSLLETFSYTVCNVKNHHHLPSKKHRIYYTAFYHEHTRNQSHTDNLHNALYLKP